MIFQARDDMNIDLGRSFLVGDMEKDMEAARNAGVTGILVRTGYAERCRPDATPVHESTDLLTAVRWILERRTL